MVLSGSFHRRRVMMSMAGALLGCSSLPRQTFGQPKEKDRTSAGASPSVSMQASWVNDAEFIGYFVAIDRGRYQADGVNFTYLPGGPEIVADTVLLARQADIALTTPDTTVSAIAKQGAPFKIIGAQYQKNPIGVVSLRKSGIKNPSDLIGRSLAVPPANIITAEAMLRINKISPREVRIVPYQYDPTPLIRGEVDATLDFVTNVPYTIRLHGEEPYWFLLWDFGFKTFNDTVVVREQTLHEKREALIAWLRASRWGWNENFIDPEKYPHLFAQTFFKGNGRTTDNEIYYNRAQKQLIETPDGIFSMSEQSIQENIESLNQIGLAAKRDMFVTELLREI
jgi:ABC-type nitrate/sulfonate/bicarbonate transport system substrate-binding protein